MKKRIVSLLLALVMAVSLLPVSAFAAEVDVPAAQDVPAVEQQNDENTAPDTPATTEESTQPDAEPAASESQPEEPVVQDAEPKILVSSNIWDPTVTVVESAVEVKGGETLEVEYSGERLKFVVEESVTVSGVKCDLAYIAINDKEYAVKGLDIKLTDVAGFKGTVWANDYPVVGFYAGGELTQNVSIRFIYGNVPANTETPTYTPVVVSANTSYGTIGADALSFEWNANGSSIWNVTATPKNEWYKLDYVADEAGNRFVSTDGKTAQITVTAADQKFTAYFTSTIAPMYDETNADSVTVNVTISNDGIPLMGADGTILANLDVTVPYFDLADYGLSRFYRYGTEFGWGNYNDDELIERPTALHAYIYLIERYYMGLPASQCGKGTSGILDYKKATDVLYMDGGLAYNSNRTPALLPTGDATSLYMKQFWGHDENLMYFRNHEYPLMGKGWGSTCDYILLSDGDRLDVAMFTNWDFYKDGGFNQFSQDVYSIAQGDTVTTSTFKAGTSAGLDGESPALEPISGLNVAVYDADWNKVAAITGDGTYSYTFDKAGTYYMMATDTGAKTTAAHYAPAITKVTVAPRDDSGAVTLKNAADMLWFQSYVNEQGHYDAKAVLANDIDISGLDWQGLGENVMSREIASAGFDGGYRGAKAFTGEIDGQGHTLTVNFTESPLVNLLAGTVKNLTIKGKSAAGTAFVRYLLTNGHIENCINYASVSGQVYIGASTDDGVTSAFAAIACRMYNTKAQRKVVVTNCINYGDIHVKHGVDCVGGIISKISTNSGGIEVTRCKNYGAVMVTTKSYNITVGGIIGISSLDSQYGVTLTDCENHGEVSIITDRASSSVRAAGIIARFVSEEQTVSRCLNTGSISSSISTGLSTGFVGGIIAVASGAPNLIESCVNTGKITGMYAGGIVADNFGEITNCYNTGDVTGSTAGGIAGSQSMYQAPNTHYNSTGKVSNCYTTGKVTGSSDNATIGAAVGKLHMGNIVSLEQTTYRDFQVYALEGTCAQLVGQKSENAKDATAFKTAAELKADAMLTTLGDAFKKDAGNINNGYPVLVWQVSEPCKHVDANNDHICDLCSEIISNHVDANNDHVCDICGKAVSNHEDKNNDHVCDVCGKAISNHEDKNSDHVCDVCGKTVSNHEDKNNDHVCDICGKAVSNHEDKNNDHVCDVCGKAVSNHEDKNSDHVCDVCGKAVSNHEDKDNNHVCDVCGKTVSNHEDKNSDHVCDVCGKTVSNHEGGTATCTKKAVCSTCGKEYGDVDKNNHSGLKKVDAKKATTDAEGNIEYWYCSDCGKYFSDAAATKEISQADTVIPKKTNNNTKPGTKPGNNTSTGSDAKKDDGKTVKSGKTGDAGIVLYAAMGLLSLTGGAWIVGKKKKED